MGRMAVVSAGSVLGEQAFLRREAPLGRCLAGGRLRNRGKSPDQYAYSRCDCARPRRRSWDELLDSPFAARQRSIDITYNVHEIIVVKSLSGDHLTSLCQQMTCVFVDGFKKQKLHDIFRSDYRKDLV